MKALTVRKAESVNCRERELFEKLRALTVKSVNVLTLTQQLKVNRKFN
jgi:hypothetical protein